MEFTVKAKWEHIPSAYEANVLSIALRDLIPTEPLKVDRLFFLFFLLGTWQDSTDLLAVFEGLIDQHPYSSIIVRPSLFRENAS